MWRLRILYHSKGGLDICLDNEQVYGQASVKACNYNISILTAKTKKGMGKQKYAALPYKELANH